MSEARQADSGATDTAPAAWEVTSSRVLAEYEMFAVREDRARRMDDDREETFHVARSPGGVVVVARNEDGRLVMVEQFRHGSGRMSLELPSGVSEPGETPVETALRELREETGFEGGTAREVGCVELNPSWQTSRVCVVEVPAARQEGPPHPDRLEELAVSLWHPAELRRRILEGEVDCCLTVAALALWQWDKSSREDAR